MTGRRLTQRKIDNLRDAIKVVAETTQVTDNKHIDLQILFGAVRINLDRLQQLLEQGGKKK